MRQVVQGAGGGPVRVVEVPAPVIGPTEVLVRTLASAVSPGTERAVTALARAGLVAKARARPDLVRQVVAKARREGLAATAASVRGRLSEDVPLGYSAAGVALEVGEAVPGVAPGQLVATGGAGRANHAELQAVPGLLCAPVPPGVGPEEAAFATVASVALHGLRLAQVGAGSKVAVVGLGLLGHLALRLAQAAGCEVAGIDVSAPRVARATGAGALGLVEVGEDTTKAVLDWTRGRGADAVLVTAATPSSAVMGRVPALCRDGAAVVVVGDVGLDLERRAFYERELSVRFARSYGPGRHERAYEDWGVDYPPGLVRWSEGRNLEAVLDLMAAGRLDVADLITHRLPLGEAPAAYRLVEEGGEGSLGIVFTYPGTAEPARPVALRPPRPGSLGVGLVGAGAFARTVLVPALVEAGFDRLVAVASSSGLSAARLGRSAGFEQAVAGAEAVIEHPDVGVVVVATAHDSHAALAARALRAGKHVFCEKPLALSSAELEEVEAAHREGGGVLFVGFNRRWSAPVRAVTEHLGAGGGPLVVTYRVNAGALPPGHWYHDRRQGGRLLGEVCHFVDTCAALVGADATGVAALGSGAGERLLADHLVVSLAYPEGSLATVSYAPGGHPSMPKERIEVLGRGRSAVIDDFRSVVLNGRVVKPSPQGKGHRAEVAEFHRLVVSATGGVAVGLGATRTTLEAADHLLRGP